MIDFEVRGRVALITINRPEARNADQRRGRHRHGGRRRAPRGRRRAVGRRDRRATARCSPPARTSRRSPPAARGQRWTERGGFAGITRLERRKPLIAAVDGPALAGGCEIVLTCDLVVASTAAPLRHPRGQALADRRRRRPVPPAPRAAAQRRHGARPHRRPDRRRARLRVRPGQRAVRAGRRRSTRALALAERICANAPMAVQRQPRTCCADDARRPTRRPGGSPTRRSRRVMAERGLRRGPARVHREARAGLDRALGGDTWRRWTPSTTSSWPRTRRTCTSASSTASCSTCTRPTRPRRRSCSATASTRRRTPSTAS